MSKAYKCDNCKELYEGYQQAECISTKQEEVNAIKLVAYKGSYKADICKSCMISYAQMLQNYFLDGEILSLNEKLPSIQEIPVAEEDDIPF